jgi:DNA polymerase-3 subunit epsilon
MKILIADTETNGLPKDKRAPMQKVNNWPRITELAWEVFDLDTLETHAKHCFLIKPDGWTIPKGKFFLDNGFSTEKSMAEGVDLFPVLDMFTLHLKHSDLIVAHNLDFDYPVIGAEMIRARLTTGRSIPQFCTMKASTNIVKLPGNYGTYKWPNLSELHKFLFGKDFEGAHAAGWDVEACNVCFIELVRRKLVTLPKSNPLKAV